MTLLLNIILGLVPTLILGASIAAGVDDDAHHRLPRHLLHRHVGLSRLQTAHPTTPPFD